jgi:hypothetical protein
MVAQKFGNADRDMSSRVGKKAKTKEISDKPLKGAGTDVKVSAMIGGMSNVGADRNVRKALSGKKSP